ncbi:hypothetical protein [Dyella sp. 333MFSha]|uniref:hypothetical protein n=1 Tax=Dyella sp. 333MFSha TaxID=1798240 RepID=UPI000B8A1A28|nr:hypothetical protein [Dyella sp. 333MFSha]
MKLVTSLRRRGGRVAVVSTCALLLAGRATVVSAQTTDGGSKGFLQRTAGAVMGRPAASGSTDAGTNSRGGAITEGAAYRPISPTYGSTFSGIFRTYTPVSNPGKFPRVSLYFETFGASEACWRTRATIWTSEQAHREETFDLCNAPIATKDDLGNETVMSDATTTYLGMMSRTTFAPGVPIAPDRTVGPNPPRVPFLMDFRRAPNPTQLRGQY